MSLYVAKQPIVDEDKKQLVVLIHKTSKRDKRPFATCTGFKKKGFSTTLGDYRHAPQCKIFFVFFRIMKLINSLLSELFFQQNISMLTPSPLIQSLIRKVRINTNFQHPLNIRAVQTGAVLGVCEC